MNGRHDKVYVSLYCKIYTENFSNEMIGKYATGKDIYKFLLKDAKCCLPLKGDCNLWYLGCNEKFGTIIYKERVWSWHYGESSFDRVQEFIDAVYQDGHFTGKQHQYLSEKITEGRNIGDMYQIYDYLAQKNKQKSITRKGERKYVFQNNVFPQRGANTQRKEDDQGSQTGHGIPA